MAWREQWRVTLLISVIKSSKRGNEKSYEKESGSIRSGEIGIIS